ncbi:MAG: class I SAM-dependent methyltransferase [Vicinamibacterales bacterium]
MTVADRRLVSIAADIDGLVDEVPGWSPADQLFALSLLAQATSQLDGDLIEVGSWFGRSAIVLAAAARDTHGLVHCIDLFPTRDDWRRNADGTYSFTVEIDGRQYGGYQEQTVWADPFERQLQPLYAEAPDILTQFRNNLKARRLDQYVRAHRGTSTTFAAAAGPSLRARLVFIDGDHGYRAVINDIDRLEPFLVPGGWLLFDDAFSTYDGVNQAIAERILDNPAYDLKRQLTRKCFAARRAPFEIR